MHCPTCHRTVPDTGRFCAYCGALVQPDERPTRDQLWQLYEKLPEDLKEAIFSAEVADRNGDLAEKYGFHDEVSTFAALVGDVLLGILPPKQFNERLRKELGLEPKVADALFQDAQQLIFEPLQEGLDLLYKNQISSPQVAAKRVQRGTKPPPSMASRSSQPPKPTSPPLTLRAKSISLPLTRFLPVSLKRVIRSAELVLLVGIFILIDFLYPELTPEAWRALAIYLAMVFVVAFVEQDADWGAVLGSVCGAVTVITAFVRPILRGNWGNAVGNLICFPGWALIFVVFVVVPGAIGFVGGLLGQACRPFAPVLHRKLRKWIYGLIAIAATVALIALIAVSLDALWGWGGILYQGSDPLDKTYSGAYRWAKRNLPRRRHLTISHLYGDVTALLQPEVISATVVEEHAWAAAYYGCNRQGSAGLGDLCRQKFPGTGYIVYSPNYGRSWEIQKQIPNWLPVTGWLGPLEFITKTEGYAIGDTGILYTDDSGKHWSFLTLPSEIQEIREVESIEGYHLVISVISRNDDRAKYESFDGGKTWQQE